MRLIEKWSCFEDTAVYSTHIGLRPEYSLKYSHASQQSECIQYYALYSLSPHNLVILYSTFHAYFTDGDAPHEMHTDYCDPEIRRAETPCEKQ